MTTIFLGLIILSSLVVIKPWIKILIKAIDSKKWPFIVGEITRSKFKSEHYIENEYSNPNEYFIWRDVEYKYEINGVKYIGNRISYRITIKDKNWIKESNFEFDYKRFKEGQKVKIYYNPNAITESVLIPGLTIDIIFTLIISAVFYIAILAFLYVMMK